MWLYLHQLISPKIFFKRTSKILPGLIFFFILLMSYGLVGSFLAPADYLQGDAFRIIYLHVPCAFLSLFIYAVMASAAVSTLIFKLKLAPLVVRHSAPIGATFTFLALITGSIWGKPMWGTWWIWDARLTSELILFFIYLGVILFDSAVYQRQSRDRVVAILILVGFIDIPIIHFSVNWWNTLHQGTTLRLFSPSTIDPSMEYPLLVMICAFILYYGIVLILKMNYELISIQRHQHWLRETIK